MFQRHPLVLRNFVISHEMSVRSPEKCSHRFRMLFLQPHQKLKREKVMGNMEERGGRDMPEGKAGREEEEREEGKSGREGGEEKKK